MKSFITEDGEELKYTSKIANLCFNFYLSKNPINRKKIYDTFIFPYTVYSIVNDRKIKYFNGDIKTIKYNKSIFSNQLTVNLCNNNINDTKIKYSIKIFSTGKCQVSKSKSFDEQLIVIHQLREIFSLYFEQPDFDDISLTSTSSNITIITDVDIIDLNKLYNKLLPDYTFYDLVYIPEITSKIKLTIGNYTYGIFKSGKVTVLGKNVNNLEDVNNIINEMLTKIAKYII